MTHDGCGMCLVVRGTHSTYGTYVTYGIYGTYGTFGTYGTIGPGRSMAVLSE